MPLTLVQLLAARGLAQVDLQAAEARRVKLGGGLETSLLELGAVQEAKIGELWSEASRLPRPPAEMLSEVAPAMASLFPQQLAERYGMVPLGLVRRQLSLLARHPVDLSTVDEISFLLSRPLKLFVGTELEIAELLGVVYGVVVPPRLKELRLKLGPVAPPSVAPASLPANIAPASLPADVAPVSPPASVAPASPPTDVAPASPPAEVVPASPPASVAPASLPADPVPADDNQPVSVESALASMSAPAEQPISLPLKRSLSPEPWSINLPLREPASASSRSRPPLVAPEPMPPQPQASAEPAPQPEASEAIEPTPVHEEPQAEPRAEPSPEVPADPAAEPSVAAPVLALEPAPEPVASQPAPSEPQPSAFEATPMSSGYGARLGQEHRISAGEALTALRQEQTRDGVIGVAVDFLRGAFDFVAVFVRHEDTFQVFEATGIEYGGGADLTQTIVDIDRSRVLHTVVDGKAPYVGPIPAGDPLEGALGALGRGRLRAVLMYPIVIRDRTVAVVHGDRGGEALAPRQLSDVALVLSQLGGQLERVIRERRQARRPPAHPPVAPASVPAERTPASVPSKPLPLRLATPPPLPLVAPASVPAEPLPPPIATPPPLPVAPASVPAERAPASVPAERAPAPVPAEIAASAAPPPPPPPEVFDMAPPAEEEDFDALRAAQYENPPGGPSDLEEEPFEIPVEWVDQSQGGSMADQVRAFLSGDPPARALAAEALRAGGEDAAWALSERFPGPLFVFRMTIDELPAPEAMGTVIGMLASLGTAALPALASLTESPSEERRFWATMLLAKTGDHSAVPVLARRLLDPSPDVNHAARRGLWRLRKSPEFTEVLEHAISELGSGDPERTLPLIRALGQFHHVPAIPLLIGMLGARDPQVSQSAVEALREIARQDFSTSERRWTAWWEQARNRPRLHWIIDALEDRDRDLRLAAISELTELTGFDLGYQSDLDPGRQAPALARWREWLERDGRARATPMPFPAAGS